MKNFPGLVRRGSVYYVRVRVPRDLLGVLTRRELKQSLETKDVREARRWLPGTGARELRHDSDEMIQFARALAAWFGRLGGLRARKVRASDGGTDDIDRAYKSIGEFSS